MLITTQRLLASLNLLTDCLTAANTHAAAAAEEKRSSEDRARADLQCQQLQQQVHGLQVQMQTAEGQVAEAHRLRLEAHVAADAAIDAACQRLDALEPRLQRQISQAEQVGLSLWTWNQCALTVSKLTELLKPVATVLGRESVRWYRLHFAQLQCVSSMYTSMMLSRAVLACFVWLGCYCQRRMQLLNEGLRLG